MKGFQINNLMDEINGFSMKWPITTLGKEFSFQYGKGLPKEKRNTDGQYPVFGSNGVVGCHDEALVDRPCIIVGRKGTAGAVHLASKPCWPIDTTYFVIPPEDYDLHFSYYLLKHLRLGDLDRSTAIPGLNREDAYKLNIPLPPLCDQQRIVAKIEELFSQLDAAEAALKRAKANLKRYRQAVLQAAIEGRAGTVNISDEPVEKVLKRVWAERKIKFPAIPFDVAELPNIPENWCWVGIEQLTDGSRNAMKAGPFGSALKKEFYVPTGYKIYGQEQVIKGDPFFGDYYIDAEMFNRLKSCEVKPGDVLVSLVGTIGKVLILPDNIEPGIINPRLVKFSLDSTLIISEYFRLYLESKTAKDYFSIASHGQTMDVLNLGILKKLPIPLPPLNEQKRIIDELQSKFALTEVSDHSCNNAFRRISRLRQSILQQAFSGQLLP